MVFTLNEAIEPYVLPAAADGDPPLTYAITPALPAGLSFDPATRTLSGMPTEAAAGTWTYTVSDSDDDTDILTFRITVEGEPAEDLAPDFGGAAVADQVYTQNISIEPLTLPSASGGDGSLSYALTPALPAGLSFDAATRTLSGTPAAASEAATYTWTATDADATDPDSVSLTFVLTVEADLAPEFGDAAVADQAYTQNTAIETLTLPEASGGNAPLTYALSPAPPSGLSLDAAARTLSGTPSEAAEAATWTWTATDEDGDSASLTFSLTVEADLMPEFGDAAIADQVFTQNAAIEPLVLPAATGGDAPLTYELTPSPPAGLSLDTASRTLSGAPAAAAASATYTWTVSDADGDTASLTFSLTVEAPAAPQDNAVLNDALAAHGRALLTGATTAIGERFRASSHTPAPAAAPQTRPGGQPRTTGAPRTPTRTGAPIATPQSQGRSPAAPLPQDAAPATQTHSGPANPLTAIANWITGGASAQGFAPTQGAPAPAMNFAGNGSAAAGAGGSPSAGFAPQTAHAGACSPFGLSTPTTLGIPSPSPLGAGASPLGTSPSPLGAAGAPVGAGASPLGAGMSGAQHARDPFATDCSMQPHAHPGAHSQAGIFNTVGSLFASGHSRDWNVRELLQGRSFAVPLSALGLNGNSASGAGAGAGAAEPGRWAVWGALDGQTFDGVTETGRHDGSMASLYLGIDARLGSGWLAGAALSSSRGESDYSHDGSTGRLNTELNAIHPYIRGEMESGMELWAIGGFGQGEAEHLSGGARTPEVSDLQMTMAAAGLRQPLSGWRAFEFSLVGGAGFLSLTTEDGVRAVDGLDAGVTQGRLALEVSLPSSGMAPYVRLGARGDGGDGQAGGGLEVIGGVRFGSERVDFEAQGRWLAAYSESDYEEYGGMARLAVKSRTDGTGLSLSLSPTWGAAAGGAMFGADTLLGSGPAAGAMPGMAPGGIGAVGFGHGVAGGMGGIGHSVAGPAAGSATRLMLDGQLGYGFHWPRLRGLLSPIVVYGRGDGWTTVGAGLAYQSLPTLLGRNLTVELSVGAERRLGMPADHQALLKFTLLPWGAASSASEAAAPSPRTAGHPPPQAAARPRTNLPAQAAALPRTNPPGVNLPRLPQQPTVIPPKEAPVQSAPVPLNPVEPLELVEPLGTKTSRLHEEPATLPAVDTPAPAAAAEEPEASVLALPESYYAVQLMALGTRENVDRYVARHNLQDVLHARVESGGQTLHVLILGAYPDRESARRAASNLPPALRDITPWVRSVASLQQAMQAMHDKG